MTFSEAGAQGVIMGQLFSLVILISFNDDAQAVVEEAGNLVFCMSKSKVQLNSSSFLLIVEIWTLLSIFGCQS